MQSLRKLATRIGSGRMIGLVLLAALVLLRIWDPPALTIARLKTFDLYQMLKPREAAELPVVIADIDEKSLRELGQWPWPRTVIADMLLAIGQAGGIAVAFDVVFAEEDRLSPDRINQSISGLSAETVDELSKLPNNDRIMADMMGRMRVVVGQPASAERPPDDRPVQAQTPVAVLGPDPKPFLFQYPDILRNIAPLEDAATGKGLFSINPDMDSIVRRVALAAVADDKIQPSLSVELLRVGTGQNAFAIKSDEAGIKSVVVGGVEVPTDRNGRIWIHYTPHDPERFVSISDLVNGTFDPNLIRNHLVLVGPSATGLLDLKATPLDPIMPGVEVHAQILETILGQSYLTRPNYALGAELVIGGAISLLVIVLVPILGAIPVLVLGMVVSAAVFGGSWYLFTEQKILLDVIYPLLTSFIVFLVLMFLNYRREELKRQEIRSAFGQYLAPDYVEQIAENPESLTLGGETRTMTFLFSDVRGFTGISESYKGNPQGLTALMNRFLTPLSNAIMSRQGTIDKYMGDAVMAFWNAPLQDDQHTHNACEAALEMVRSLDTVNAEREKEAEEAGEDFLRLNVGIGVNTGECVVGNMGSEFRFDYSVLGDDVNLASRLEGQSKAYGVTIIVGDATASAVGDEFALVEIDKIQVKGKQEPVRIYCLLGDGAKAAHPAFQADKAAFGELLTAYRSQDWSTARSIADQLSDSSEKDFRGLAGVYLERITEFEATPPPADWDGVFVATSK